MFFLIGKTPIYRYFLIQEINFIKKNKVTQTSYLEGPKSVIKAERNAVSW